MLNSPKKSSLPGESLPTASLPFPLDQQTLLALRKGGFILYGQATIGDEDTVIVQNGRIQATSIPLVSPDAAVGGNSYLGAISSNVAGTPFPAGWTVAHGETGEYTITHDLDLPADEYMVFFSCHSSYWSQYNKSTNSFTVFWWLSQAALADCDFDFMLIPTSGGGGVSGSCTDGQLTISGPAGAVVNYLIVI